METENERVHFQGTPGIQRPRKRRARPQRQSSPGSKASQTSQRLAQGTAGKACRESPSANPIRVVVVDDYPGVRAGASRLLGLEPGITVVACVERPDECFEELGRLPADVVLMEFSIPGMDAVRAVRRLKAKRPDVRIVAFSSFGEEHLDNALRAAVDGHVLKTAGKAGLVNAVVRAANGSRSIGDRQRTAGSLNHEWDQLGRGEG